MAIADFAPVRALWLATEGVGLNECDTEPAIAAYLARNPRMSAVAVVNAEIIGAVLCGHDARRGYLNHLAVAPAHRRRGIATALLKHCFDALDAAGIQRCNLFVYADNLAGQEFWLRSGWGRRADLLTMQKPVRG
jgi:ribosomal protein S18 acetylase RimI-like enzyme